MSNASTLKDIQLMHDWIAWCLDLDYRAKCVVWTEELMYSYRQWYENNGGMRINEPKELAREIIMRFSGEHPNPFRLYDARRNLVALRGIVLRPKINYSKE